VARATLVACLVIGGLALLWRIQEILLLLLTAILFATAIEPLVNVLRRGPFNRAQGILAIYVAIVLTLSMLGYFVLPSLFLQASEFVALAPERVATLRPVVEGIGPRVVREAALQGLADLEYGIGQVLAQPTTLARTETIVAAGNAIAHTLLGVVTVFLLAYYWLTERAIIKRAALRMVPPDRARHVNDVWLQVEEKMGGWVRGQLLIMLAIGLMAGLVFVGLGLPNPLLLAALASVCEIIPLVGPFLAFLPALLVTLSTDPTKVLILLPLALVIQQIEGNVLIPRIMSHSVGVSPLTVILGILIGSLLYGAIGAFLAVPVAASIQVILNETLRPALEYSDQPPLTERELEGGTPDPAEPDPGGMDGVGSAEQRPTALV
jgi:predicted PurR-regulated permease PerM